MNERTNIKKLECGGCQSVWNHYHLSLSNYALLLADNGQSCVADGPGNWRWITQLFEMNTN
jgi:hypothetical protein